ncbi:hypothetical protein AB4Y87_10370 [Paenarthrobacter sp. RAF54_2]|uniref:hypothetical protein n=1 Tax=Paenarthrobacter sp. RAF54_2 TaxID=3233061 RepID=UPI003F9440AB
MGPSVRAAAVGGFFFEVLALALRSGSPTLYDLQSLACLVSSDFSTRSASDGVADDPSMLREGVVVTGCKDDRDTLGAPCLRSSRTLMPVKSTR